MSPERSELKISGCRSAGEMRPGSAGVSPADSPVLRAPRHLALQRSSARSSAPQVTGRGGDPCQDSRGPARTIATGPAMMPPGRGTPARTLLAAESLYARHDTRCRSAATPVSRPGASQTAVHVKIYETWPGPAGRRIRAETGTVIPAAQSAPGDLADTAPAGASCNYRRVWSRHPQRRLQHWFAARRPPDLFISQIPCRARRAGAPDTDPSPGRQECCVGHHLIELRRCILPQKR
jgi:hypothetical protein